MELKIGRFADDYAWWLTESGEIVEQGWKNLGQSRIAVRQYVLARQEIEHA